LVKEYRSMGYTRVGTSGLKVSQIALGCMSYGDPGFRQWTLDEDASQPFFRQAVELGITFWPSPACLDFR
jgi:aryl-alcohol dehydrogenase-like predicted oxidoreductase